VLNSPSNASRLHGALEFIGSSSAGLEGFPGEYMRRKVRIVHHPGIGVISRSPNQFGLSFAPLESRCGKTNLCEFVRYSRINCLRGSNISQRF
jgi:hypothetical protein